MNMKQIRQGSLRRLFYWGCMALPLLWLSPAYGTTRLYSDPPRVEHVDVKNNVLIIASGEGFHAQHIDSGRRLWSRSWPDRDKSNNLRFNDSFVLVEISNGFQVIDKITGRDLWTRQNQQLGRLQVAYFIGDGAWVQALFDDGTLLYTPEGNVLSALFEGKKLEGANASGWMPDGKTLLHAQRGRTDDTANTLTVYFWDTESGDITKGYVFTGDGTPLLYRYSDSENTYLLEINIGGIRGRHALKEIDAHTGTVLRTVELPEAFHTITEEGHALIFNNEMDTATLMNPASGETVAAIGREGHSFILATLTLKHGGKWICSVDENWRYYLWAIEDGVSPRMIFEPPPGAYLPGPIAAIKPPYLLCQMGRDKMGAFLLEGMERVKVWHADGELPRVLTAVTSDDMNRILAWHYEPDADTGETIWRTEVFEAHNPEPLLTVPGISCGLSPDGRFCAAQHPRDKGPVSIVEVDSGKIIATVLHETTGPATVVFSPDSGKTLETVARETMRSANVVFSPDSRFAMIHTTGEDTLLSLSDGHAQRAGNGSPGTVFSPDGNYYLLQWPHGQATVYDSSTGKAVRSFVEPDKVAARQSRPPRNFLQTAENFGRNLLGRVITVAPATPMLTCGFTVDGTQFITLAEGQILRVWDIRSGKMIRTIRTRLPEQRNAAGQINNRLVLSDNGAYAFAYNSDRLAVATLWDTATGRAVSHQNLPAGRINQIAVANDGAGVYLSLDDGLYFLAGKKR